MNPTPSLNVITDVQQVLAYQFMVNAVRAGAIVAVLAGVVGWFMVLRRESFAGHTLAVVGFPGAAAAAWLGVATGYGYFVACVAAAAAIAWWAPGTAAGGGGESGEQSAIIGTVQAVALATGLLFVSLYHGFLSGLTNLLFGTIAGVSGSQVLALVVAAVLCLAALAAVGRPLLWTSIDPDTAGAQGIPTRLVAVVFLLVLGVAAAGASQVTGSLLVFALLVCPPATAQRLTARPALGIALSALIALAVTWIGMGFAFFTPYPIGFWVSSFAYATYVLASGYRAVRDRGHQRVSRSPAPAVPAPT
ncbi:MAG: metal ABC transporter permease [Mycobacteriaceae bacterium]|nr:metal ABC transporter permease [Mycobacteriaceae bacterium]